MRTKHPKSKLVDQIKSTSKKEAEKVSEPVDADNLSLVSTGSTLFNLACSDKLHGGFGMGKMVNLIGDSSSGKTFIALTVLAELTMSDEFSNHTLIYDDVEAACEFDIEKLFGKNTSERISSPAIDEDDEELSSETVEDFQGYIHELLDKENKFVYVLDSLDALDSEDDKKKVKQQMEDRKKGKETTGTYGMAKPKKIGEILRQICRRLKKTDSLLIIVSQTRDNINPMSFEKKTRSGGRALKFYATHEIWTAVAKKLKKKERVIGIECKAKITKNKITGKVRTVEFPIFYDYGIDDIGSMIDFLLVEGTWSKAGKKINSPMGLMTRESLIKKIEDKNLEDKLKKAVAKTWNQIEDGLKLNRKGKYK